MVYLEDVRLFANTGACLQQGWTPGSPNALDEGGRGADQARAGGSLPSGVTAEPHKPSQVMWTIEPQGM